LILAWGVTIHKAQGATLDEVVIHFKESFKDPGQAYVALSRVRSIDGLGFIGKFQARHLKSFSFRHIRFVSGLDSDQRINSSAVVNKISFSDLEQAFLERTPWREVGWLQRVLEHYVDYVPAIKDNTGFNLRRRIVYLRDFTGIHPSQFLVNQANREGLESALDICRNLERSIRNKLPILRGDYAEGEFDEFCLDNYEISESNYRSLSWGRQDDKASLLAAVGQGRDVVPLEDLRAAQEADLQEIYWISKSGRQSSIEVSKSGRSWTYFDSVNSTGGVSINNDSLFFTMLDYRDDFDPRGCNEIYFKGSLSDTEACLWLRYMFSNLQDIQVTINGNYRGKYSALV
jgi:hypothetical protein